MGISWDSVFQDGVVSERMMAQSAAGSNESKAVACATALLGWANCMAGHRPPAKFGEGKRSDFVSKCVVENQTLPNPRDVCMAKYELWRRGS